jgi:hypothetical protein
MIATVDDIKTKARFVSTHLDAAKVAPLIRESELAEIRYALGDDLYLQLDEYVANLRTPENDRYNALLDGCTWEKEGKKRIMVGIIEIISYLTQGRLIKLGDLAVTRAGNVFKQGEQSDTADLKERIVYYKDAFHVAQEYLQGVVEYVRYFLPQEDKAIGRGYPKSVMIKAIGD